MMERIGLSVMHENQRAVRSLEYARSSLYRCSHLRGAHSSSGFPSTDSFIPHNNIARWRSRVPSLTGEKSSAGE